MKTRAVVSMLLAAAGAAMAQPSQLPPPIPTAVVPPGNDFYGFPFLAPGAFPTGVYAGLVRIDSFPGGYILDGTNSNYLRIPYDPSVGALPIGREFSGATNEGDLDPNLSLNPGLLDCSLPDRCAFAFPNTNWDTVFGSGGQASFGPSATGEPVYAWAATAAAGVMFVQVAQNGRDNDATFAGIDAGTLYATAHCTPNDFRGGAGYNMLTGLLSNGNGTMYLSFNAAGAAQEYIIDIAPTWFPFVEGWTAGTIRGGSVPAWNTSTVAPDPLTGLDVNWPARSPNLPEDASDVVLLAGDGTARGTIDLSSLADDAATPADSMLFIQHCGSSNDDKVLNILQNGSTWTYVQRLDANLDATGLTGFAGEGDNDLTFVAIPYASRNLVGGSINADGTVARGAGSFTISQDAANPGRYFLTIPGVSGEQGVLLLQPTGAAPGDADLPGRAFMSYDFDAANNRYVIEAHEVTAQSGANVFNEAYPLISTSFYVVYTGFASPLAPPADCAPDLTGEGDVNINDFFAFLALYQAMDPRADFAPGGGINVNDFFAFLAAYQLGC